jgi:tRNA(Ile)-lysidine synthase
MRGSPGSRPPSPPDAADHWTDEAIVGEPVDLTVPVVAELVGRCSFPSAGSAVTCAVSGGPDSLALLVLAVAAGCDATAVHVDHCLRDGSAREADVVADVAARLGAGFRAERSPVEPGPNLEARARAARFAVLPEGVLTGHTTDDRVESVLLNLIRGSGPAGLAGMARSPSRPLIDLRRTDTERLCAELGLDPVRDPSNSDPTIRRNRVRHELLPLLADIGERDVVPIVARTADLLEDEVAAMSELASTIDPSSVAELRGVPVAVARVAVRTWLIEGGVGDGYPVDADAVERTLAVIRGDAVATEVVGGWRVARSRGRLTLTPPGTWQDAPHG